MADRPQSDPPTDNLTMLGEAERDAALCRFKALRPDIQHGVTPTKAASAANVPVCTLQRWVARHRKRGLAGLARRRRSDGKTEGALTRAHSCEAASADSPFRC